MSFARRQPGCQALQARHYGVGWLCAVIMWAEVGDARRFPSSEQLVRYAGLDVTVYSSAGKRFSGHLSRQGSPELRWAAFEAAKRDGKRATLAVERKLLLRRCYHTLHELGDAAVAMPISEHQAA